jgi:hypothetical protein
MDATAVVSHGLWTAGEGELVYVTELEVAVEMEEYEVAVELEKE